MLIKQFSHTQRKPSTGSVALSFSLLTEYAHTVRIGRQKKYPKAVLSEKRWRWKEMLNEDEIP